MWEDQEYSSPALDLGGHVTKNDDGDGRKVFGSSPVPRFSPAHQSSWRTRSLVLQSSMRTDVSPKDALRSVRRCVGIELTSVIYQALIIAWL